MVCLDKQNILPNETKYTIKEYYTNTFLPGGRMFLGANLNEMLLDIANSKSNSTIFHHYFQAEPGVQKCSYSK